MKPDNGMTTFGLAWRLVVLFLLLPILYITKEHDWFTL